MAIKSDRCRKCGRDISEDPECAHFCKECESKLDTSSRHPDNWTPPVGSFIHGMKQEAPQKEVVVRRKNAAEKIDIINKVHFSMRSNSMSEACKINEVALPSYKSWCADVGMSIYPEDRTKTVTTTLPANAVELAAQLAELVQSCIIVLEMKDGKTIHFQLKGEKQKMLHDMAALQLTTVSKI